MSSDDGKCNYCKAETSRKAGLWDVLACSDACSEALFADLDAAHAGEDGARMLDETERWWSKQTHWHDHGTWRGTCSPEKHQMLLTGIKRRYHLDAKRVEIRQEPWAESMARAIECCVFVDGIGHCACCRQPISRW